MIVINTSLGDIRLQLDEAQVPKTVANFLKYVREGFYDETLFHRVIGGFMIQGGGLTSAMQPKAASAPIENEAKMAKPNRRGTIAMARTNNPHSATTQFFINLADNAFLNYRGDQPDGYGYCVFGEVVDGMDVVDAIARVKTGQRHEHGDVPLENVMIHRIFVLDEDASEHA